jgi:hypothetical protein
LPFLVFSQVCFSRLIFSVGGFIPLLWWLFVGEVEWERGWGLNSAQQKLMPHPDGTSFHTT